MFVKKFLENKEKDQLRRRQYKMTKKFDVSKLSLEGGCKATLIPQRNLYKPWKNWQAWIILENDSGKKNLDSNTQTLKLEGYEGAIYVPPRRSIEISGTSKDSLEGKLYCGHIKGDSKLDVNIPFTTEKVKELDWLKNLGVDIFGTAVVSLAVYAGFNGVGLSPENYWDSIGVGSTAVWAAAQGGKRTMIHSSLLALGMILGPEISQGVQGLKELGFEDLLKGGLFGVSLPVGKKIREYVTSIIYD